MLESLYIENIISCMNIAETFISADKFAELSTIMYNRYKTGLRIFPCGIPNFADLYYNIILFDEKISFAKITFEYSIKFF